MEKSKEGGCLELMKVSTCSDLELWAVNCRLGIVKFSGKGALRSMKTSACSMM